MKWDRTIDDALEEGELILDAIQQVRDPEIEASEYDFWDDLESVHPAPSHKGNDGLANWIANLAVIKSDDEGIVVDEGLVDEADKRLTEEHDSYRFRKRFNNIVRDSENRSGEKLSLAENTVKGLNNGTVDGHHRLMKQVDALYRELGKEEKIEKLYKDKGLLPLRDYMVEVSSVGEEDSIEPTEAEGYVNSDEMPGTTVWEPEENDTISSKPENNQHNQGGDNDMGLLEQISSDAQDYMQDGMDAGAAYEQAIDDYDDAIDEVDSRMQSIETGLRQELLAVNVKGAELEKVVGRLEGKLDAKEDNLSDTMDSIRASYDNITDR